MLWLNLAHIVLTVTPVFYPYRTWSQNNKNTFHDNYSCTLDHHLYWTRPHCYATSKSHDIEPDHVIQEPDHVIPNKTTWHATRSRDTQQDHVILNKITWHATRPRDTQQVHATTNKQDHVTIKSQMTPHTQNQTTWHN